MIQPRFHLTPLTRRRLAQFQANRRGYWSLWLFLVLFGLSLSAEFIANDRPLLVVHQGSLHVPVIRDYAETDFGGFFPSAANYRDPHLANLIEEDGWVLWPPIRFRHALIRSLCGVVEILFFLGAPALVIALCSKRFRRLGDHLAGTVVVRNRTAAPSARAVRFLPPPGWEDYTAHLDTTRLTRAHYRLVRAFLVRARAPPAATDVLAEVTDAMGLDPRAAHALQVYDPTLPLTAIAASYQRRFSPDPVPVAYATVHAR